MSRAHGAQILPLAGPLQESDPTGNQQNLGNFLGFSQRHVQSIFIPRFGWPARLDSKNNGRWHKKCRRMSVQNHVYTDMIITAVRSTSPYVGFTFVEGARTTTNADSLCCTGMLSSPCVEIEKPLGRSCPFLVEQEEVQSCYFPPTVYFIFFPRSWCLVCKSQRDNQD